MTIKRPTMLLGLAMLAGCSQHASSIVSTAKPPAGERVAARLKTVERMELFAIDPLSRGRSTQPTSQANDADRFYGYRVLGRATVEDRVAPRRLADSIAAAVSDPPDSDGKACAFVPRHGVRFTLANGATIDFIVCFTCGDADMMSGGRFSDQFWIDRGAMTEFNALFQRYGLPLPVVD